MFKLKPAAVTVVADDTRAALTATDRALRANTQMLLSVLDSAEGSDVPMHVTQNLYAALAASNGSIVQSRENLRRSMTFLTAIKNRSDQRETALGCPGGLPEEGRAHEPAIASV